MKYFLLMFFIGLSMNITCQNYDSLKNNVVLAEQQGHDSLTMDMKLELLLAYYRYSADSIDLIISNAEECIKFAKEKNFVEGEARALNHIGIQLRNSSRFEEALEIYDEIIALCEDHNLRLRQSKMIGNKGNVYMMMGKSDEALQLKLDALSIIHEMGDSNAIAINLGSLGGVYLGFEDYEKCIEYSKESLSYMTGTGIAGENAFQYGNLAICYKSINEPDSAKHYFLKCRENSGKRKWLYNSNEAAFASFYLEQENYQSAKEILENLISQHESESTNPSLQLYKLLSATAHLKSGQRKVAKILFETIDTNYLDQSFFVKTQFNELGYLLNSESGNYQVSLDYYKEFRDASDSTQSVERRSRFKEIESKYNVAEKEKIISKQDIKLKNRLLIIGGLLSLLLFGGLLYANRVRKLRFQKQLSEQDRELKAKEIINLKQENKIISMQSMLEGQEEERKRIARDLHDNIGSLMTNIKMKILNIQREVESIEKINIAQELDSMVTNASQEVRRISHSMTPVAMDISGLHGAVEDLDYQLSSQGISYTVDADDLEQITDKQLSINIFRIIQESINNTIKHANATSVSVSAKIEGSTLNLEIKDDGSGFDPSLWDASDTIGLSGIKSRIEYLNGSVELNRDQGTHYIISIPII